MDYRVHTAQFEGPLDLLLHLIEKEELDITELALAQVTDEFLAYVESMRGHLEIDLVADFLVIAARLLWIKSQVLLPSPPQASALVQEDTGDDLVQQLRTYRLYKEAAQWLRQQDEAALRNYVHVAPTVSPQHFILDLTGVTVAALRKAAEAVLYPQEGPRPQEAIQRPRISIVQQIQLIGQRLTRLQQLFFRSLLSQKATRLEAVVTLQAILELIKQQAVQAQQGERFGDIIIAPLIPPAQISSAIETEAPAPA